MSADAEASSRKATWRNRHKTQIPARQSGRATLRLSDEGPIRELVGQFCEIHGAVNIVMQ
jgi:hypothetical protein